MATEIRAAPEAVTWQDREIRFDISAAAMQLRKGETLVDSINSVEDTKGNNGDRGSLEITNLRLLWASHKSIRTNLSIGYSCIQSLKIRTATSKLRGSTQALYVMTKYANSRFEFIFTSLVKASPRLFTTIQAVFRSYETTKLYRELKPEAPSSRRRSSRCCPTSKSTRDSTASGTCPRTRATSAPSS